MEIKAIGLTKKFSDGGQNVVALNGVDLALKTGEIIVLLGPSGSGKTTLLNLLSGLDDPTEGEVSLDGKAFSRIGDRERSFLRNRFFGFVFQFFNLLPEFTILENISLPGLVGNRGKNPAAVRKEAEEILSELGLAERKDALPAELSGGEQQRVAVGRALINKPSFIFADEPTGNLDRENADICLSLFQQMQKKYGTGFIIATHNQEIPALLPGRTIILKNGKIRQ